MKTLPMKVATYNMVDNKPIMIEIYKSGYYELPDDFDVERFNEIVGADEETVNVMVAGSMFGWDIPAVTNYGVK